MSRDAVSSDVVPTDHSILHVDPDHVVAIEQQHSDSELSSLSRQRRKINLFLVIAGIAKKTNIESLIQTALAFGIHKILVVGQRHNIGNLSPSLQAVIGDNVHWMVRFHKWRDVVTYLTERHIHLVGVEIHPAARSLEEILREETCDLAFCMGNEGDGLSPQQMDDCQSFVRISQYGSGTASLNVGVAASIIFHKCHSYLQSMELTKS